MGGALSGSHYVIAFFFFISPLSLFGPLFPFLLISFSVLPIQHFPNKESNIYCGTSFLYADGKTFYK